MNKYLLIYIWSDTVARNAVLFANLDNVLVIGLKDFLNDPISQVTRRIVDVSGSDEYDQFTNPKFLGMRGRLYRSLDMLEEMRIV